MFLGEYHHGIDQKGRLVIPSEFREALEGQFIVAKGLENCLYVYTKEDWDKIVSKLNTLSFTKKDVRTFVRSFFSGATFCELDKQGRVLIKDVLKSYAHIDKSCVILGANDRIEIWNEEDYQKFLDENSATLADIAENLFLDVNL